MDVLICYIQPGMWRLMRGEYCHQGIATVGETIEELSNLKDAKEFISNLGLDYIGCE